MAVYSYRCTNPDCIYFSFTREDKSTEIYGKFCSNCAGYDEKTSRCLFNDNRKTSAKTYCTKYIPNEEKLGETQRHCEHCGSLCYRVPSAEPKISLISKKKSQEPSQWTNIPGGRFKEGGN